MKTIRISYRPRLSSHAAKALAQIGERVPSLGDNEMDLFVRGHRVVARVAGCVRDVAPLRGSTRAWTWQEDREVDVAGKQAFVVQSTLVDTAWKIDVQFVRVDGLNAIAVSSIAAALTGTAVVPPDGHVPARVILTVAQHREPYLVLELQGVEECEELPEPTGPSSLHWETHGRARPRTRPELLQQSHALGHVGWRMDAAGIAELSTALTKILRAIGPQHVDFATPASIDPVAAIFDKYQPKSQQLTTLKAIIDQLGSTAVPLSIATPSASKTFELVEIDGTGRFIDLNFGSKTKVELVAGLGGSLEGIVRANSIVVEGDFVMKPNMKSPLVITLAILTLGAILILLDTNGPFRVVYEDIVLVLKAVWSPAATGAPDAWNVSIDDMHYLQTYFGAWPTNLFSLPLWLIGHVFEFIGGCVADFFADRIVAGIEPIRILSDVWPAWFVVEGKSPALSTTASTDSHGPDVTMVAKLFVQGKLLPDDARPGFYLERGYIQRWLDLKFPYSPQAKSLPTSLVTTDPNFPAVVMGAVPPKDTAAWAAAAAAIVAQAANLGVPVVGPIPVQPDATRKLQLRMQVGQRGLSATELAINVGCELEFFDELLVPDLYGQEVTDQDDDVVGVLPQVRFMEKEYKVLFRALARAAAAFDVGMTRDILSNAPIPLSLPPIDLSIGAQRTWSYDFAVGAPFTQAHVPAIQALLMTVVATSVDKAIPAAPIAFAATSQFPPSTLLSHAWLEYTPAGAPTWDPGNGDWLIVPIALTMPLSGHLP